MRLDLGEDDEAEGEQNERERCEPDHDGSPDEAEQRGRTARGTRERRAVKA
jgi:hypothetical protein